MCSAEEVSEALHMYFTTYETLFPRGHLELLNERALAVLRYFDGSTPSVLPLQEEKDFCLKALRMHLLYKGRKSRDERLDNAIARVLKQLPPVIKCTEVCAFCEESPQHAAMKRSCCGRCKQVVYCSAGCQKAHWPLHKKICKAQESK